MLSSEDLRDSTRFQTGGRAVISCGTAKLRFAWTFAAGGIRPHAVARPPARAYL
jgi:hypothetical protein